MGRSYNFHDVGVFHNKFGLDNVTYQGTGPRTELPLELARFRMNFLCEELQECLEGCGLSFKQSLWELVQQNTEWNTERSDAKIFDSLIDLVYVAYGFAHLMGYPWEDGWNAVQAANMAKERAERADQSERGGTWDIIKPPGWTPPDINAILRLAGWDV